MSRCDKVSLFWCFGVLCSGCGAEVLCFDTTTYAHTCVLASDSDRLTDSLTWGGVVTSPRDVWRFCVCMYVCVLSVVRIFGGVCFWWCVFSEGAPTHTPSPSL